MLLSRTVKSHLSSCFKTRRQVDRSQTETTSESAWFRCRSRSIRNILMLFFRESTFHSLTLPHIDYVCDSRRAVASCVTASICIRISARLILSPPRLPLPSHLAVYFSSVSFSLISFFSSIIFYCFDSVLFIYMYIFFFYTRPRLFCLHLALSDTRGLSHWSPVVPY